MIQKITDSLENYRAMKLTMDSADFRSERSKHSYILVSTGGKTSVRSHAKAKDAQFSTQELLPTHRLFCWGH